MFLVDCLGGRHPVTWPQGGGAYLGSGVTLGGAGVSGRLVQSSKLRMRAPDAFRKRGAEMMESYLKITKWKEKRCHKMRWRWFENGWALTDFMPRRKRIIVRLRVFSRARDLSNGRLSSSEVHRGGQRQPIISHSVHVTISNDWTGILPGFWNEVRAWYEGRGARLKVDLTH